MSKFIPGSKGGGATSLDELSDVDVSGSPEPADGQVLIYDDTQSPPQWVSADIPEAPSALDELTDVDASAPTNNQVLTYDDTQSPPQWVSADIPEAPSALDELTDVDASAPTNNQVLTYDDAQSPPQWISSNVGYEGVDSDVKGMIDAYEGMAFDKVALSVVDDGGLQIEIEKEGGGDVDFWLKSKRCALNCTTGSGTGGKARVALFPGSDASNPANNWIYVVESNGDAILTANTSVPPDTGFGWIAKIVVPDVTTWATTGAYVIQRYTESMLNSQRGLFSHEREKLRAVGALYGEGVHSTLDITANAGAPDNIHLETTAGRIYQLHRQTFPMFTTGPYFYGNGSSIFGMLNDLNEVLSTSDNTPIQNKQRFNLVVWGVANFSPEDCKLFVNLPLGTYTNDSQALADSSNTADYSVPNYFRSVGFLIARIVMQYNSNNGGTWKELATYPLLGNPPSVRSFGGGTTFPVGKFPDSTFRIQDDNDESKEIAFEATNIGIATTRTITMPDNDIMLISEAPEDGTPYSRQDAGWVISSLDSLTDVDTSGSPVPQNGEILVYNDTQWINEENPAMVWVSDYAPGSDREKNEVVLQDGWLMIANKDTSDVAAPQTSGDPFWYYTGTLVDDSSTVKQLIFGARYTWGSSGYLNGYRINVVAGNHYTIYSVADPLGVPIITERNSFEATSTGWVEFAIFPVLGSQGIIFDLLVIVNQPDPSPATQDIDWNYITPANATDPASGEIIHYNKATSELRISKNDNLGADVSGVLDILDIGDKISGVGVEWAIQSTTDNGTFRTFSVAPASQGSTDGVSTFTIETVVEVPITYGREVDAYLGNASARGLFVEDGGLLDVVETDDAFGVDLFIQSANISEDWDMLANSEGGGGSSSGNTLDGSLITDYGDTENPLGTVGGGSNNVELNDGHVITATMSANHIFNFQSGRSHSCTSWEMILKSAGFVPTFQFDASPITLPDGYDVTADATYWIAFRKVGSEVYLSERQMT